MASGIFYICQCRLLSSAKTCCICYQLLLADNLPERSRLLLWTFLPSCLLYLQGKGREIVSFRPSGDYPRGSPKHVCQQGLTVIQFLL